MKLLKILKESINNKNGIIGDIHKISPMIHKTIISELRKKQDLVLSNINNYTFILDDHEISIGSVIIDSISFIFTVHESSKLSVNKYFYVLPKPNVIKGGNVSFVDVKNVTIGVDLSGPSNTPMNEVIDYFINDRSKSIAYISHELKHAYDYIVVPNKSVKSITIYSAYYKLEKSEPLTTTKVLFRSLLYLHEFEQSVFYTEMSSRLMTDKISRDEFKEFYSKYNIVKTLSYLKNLTYKKILEDLYEYDIDSIIKILSKVTDNLENDGLLIQQYLYLLRLKIIKYLYDDYSKYFHDNFYNVSIDDIKNLDDILVKFTSEVTKNNYFLENTFNVDSIKKNQQFYESLIKNFRIESENCLKKLSKIYKIIDGNN